MAHYIRIIIMKNKTIKKQIQFIINKLFLNVYLIKCKVIRY